MKWRFFIFIIRIQVIDKKKEHKIIHRLTRRKIVNKAVDNVHKSLFQEVLSDIHDVSGTHSYQQVTVH